MKNKTKKTARAPKPSVEQSGTAKEFICHLPPGAKFSDIYMDAQQVAQELNYGKRHHKQYAQKRQIILHRPIRQVLLLKAGNSRASSRLILQ